MCMNSVKALELFQHELQSSPIIRNYCDRELNWIKNRKLDWDNDRIRVGVIGVTSSGKSTLINAILGTDILSSAIAPSSGQLVCCSYGEEARIIIHFEDGTQRILSNKNFSRANLEQYSDERFNPHNKKGVLSIELTSPLFDLGKDVLLVDSPGLDAFGLESHERLTLESLVPTIDACIYVTTMKTNSDRKTQEILNTVAKYNCPIIIVQNMLDAVRSSPSGDKTSEQVARDHRNRVQRIVDSSAIVDKDAVQIIQMSAEYAKKWRAAQTAGVTPPISNHTYKKSNYDTFVRSVSEVLAVQRPRIERQRLLSIKRCAENLYNTVQDKVNKPLKPIEAEFPLASLKKNASTHKKATQETYNKILSDYGQATSKIRIAIGVDSEEDVRTITASRQFSTDAFTTLFKSFSNRQSLEKTLEYVNDSVSLFETELANIISYHNTFVEKAASLINIPTRDLLCSSRLHTFRNVNLEKKTERKRRKVKKEGVGSAIARGFGWLFRRDDWGYEYEPYDEVVTDTELTKKKICERLQAAFDKYTKSMEDWTEKNFNRAMSLIEDEISGMEATYQRRKDAFIEAESLCDLSSSLKKLIVQIDTNLPDAAFRHYEENPEQKFTTKKIDVPAYSYAILELSRNALQQQHRGILKAFIEKIGCQQSVPVLVSWDTNCRDEFLWQTGISNVAIIDSPLNCNNLPQEKNRCIFVLVNAIQFGAALKQISALKLDSALTERDYVVWVLQDFQELLTGDRAAEGLSQMVELQDAALIPCKSTIMIMHENPVYNLAFLKYQFDPSLQKAAHKLIDELQTNFGVFSTPEVTDIIGDMLQKVHLR